MGSFPRFTLGFLIVSCILYQCSAFEVDSNQTAWLFVNSSEASSRKIPETLFGIFFEEINHAGAGGLWAELVNNRGFEAGGQNTPSNIDPWSIIGDGLSLIVATDRSSCFDRNKIALRMEVLCDGQGTNVCPVGGVGIYNPGFWGMNIEQGKTYKVVLYVRSLQSVNISVSFTGSNGFQTLATANIIAADISTWTKAEVLLEAKETDHNARLQLTTSKKGVIWFDQVSAMPLDTYKGHGFRNDLVGMLRDLKPQFIRFPGGCFVEGEWLRNAFRWKETIGPWEERPGHFGDVWKYWTDDGLGYFEFLQLAEDLGSSPVWVFNNGISHNDQVASAIIAPFLQEILDSIEFARGDSNSTWGSVRAAMGHPEPFPLRYVAVGNEDCGKKNYRRNYLKFYYAIKQAYPDIKIISNCDGSTRQLDHPADYYDYHAFVSEYAVTGKDAGTGSLLAALAEAGFLIGVERNRWNPDAIVFNSFQLYGTPSYWMQHFFTESSGGTLFNSTLQANSSSSLVASAISWQNLEDNKNYIRIKVVNFGSNTVNLKVSIDGVEPNSFQSYGSTKKVLTSSNLMDENSFKEPNKVVPVESQLEDAGEDMEVILSPHSFTSFDLSIESPNLQMPGAGTDSVRKSSN
ncbi:alpha-L-arabinofuranosidase 2 [Actinidia rufa]|uniref:non-reducing end alpha-L-arabinofuranosidase n=1 Tax=Actinidia rufa TaxID=165716 RepID=A0A7J0E8B9_9ERIC|nr:alpha-L-arabinofuranosidase 2 [Actinidia rufa]